MSGPGLDFAGVARLADAHWPASVVPGPLSPGGWRPLADDLRALVSDAPDRWLVLAQADALVAPSLPAALLAAAAERPDVDLFYADDLALPGVGAAQRVRLKPAFDIAQLAAQDYIGAPLMIRGSALHRLGGLRDEAGEAGLYDLVLRAAKAGMGVERIPRVLLAWPGERPRLAVAARRRALEAWIGERPFELAEGLTPDTLQLRRRFEDFPAVTLVSPTRQSGRPGQAPYVVKLLDSLARTDWPMDRLRVLVGDDTERAETFRPGRWPFAVTRLPTPRPAGEAFNYSAKMNRLWRAAETEHLVLMNDDVEVLQPGWLKALMTFALEPDVGGVGARLLFPDGRLQHAGVPGGPFGAVSHAWYELRGDAPTYQNWAVVHREWSMVTGAVFATRRSVLEAAGGFDERLRLEFNDVDLCLKIRLLGKRIVYTPFAELSHGEKGSRGSDPPPGEDVALFVNRWREWLDDDPAFHPRLARDRLAPEPVSGADALDLD